MPRSYRSQHRITNSLDRVVFDPLETLVGPTSGIAIALQPDTGIPERRALRLTADTKSTETDKAEIRWQLVRRIYNTSSVTSQFGSLHFYGRVILVAKNVDNDSQHIFFCAYNATPSLVVRMYRTEDNKLGIYALELGNTESIKTIPLNVAFEVRLYYKVESTELSNNGELRVAVRLPGGVWENYIELKNLSMEVALAHYGWCSTINSSAAPESYGFVTYLLEDAVSNEEIDEGLPWHFQVATLFPTTSTAVISIPVEANAYKSLGALGAAHQATHAKVTYTRASTSSSNVTIRGAPTSTALFPLAAYAAGATGELPGVAIQLTGLVPGARYQYFVTLTGADGVTVRSSSAETYTFRTLATPGMDVVETFHIASNVDQFSGEHLGLKAFAAAVDRGIDLTVSFHLSGWGNGRSIYDMFSLPAPDDYESFLAGMWALERDEHVRGYFQRTGIYFLQDDDFVTGADNTWTNSGISLLATNARWATSTRTRGEAWADWNRVYQQRYGAWLPNKQPGGGNFGSVVSGNHDFIYADVRTQRELGTIFGSAQYNWLRSHLSATTAKTVYLLTQAPIGRIGSNTDTPWQYSNVESLGLVDHMRQALSPSVVSVNTLSGYSRTGYQVNFRWDGLLGAVNDNNFGWNIQASAWGQILSAHDYETGGLAGDYNHIANSEFMEIFHSAADGPNFGVETETSAQLMRHSGMFITLGDFASDQTLNLDYQVSLATVGLVIVDDYMLIPIVRRAEYTKIAIKPDPAQSGMGNRASAILDPDAGGPTFGTRPDLPGGGPGPPPPPGTFVDIEDYEEFYDAGNDDWQPALVAAAADALLKGHGRVRLRFAYQFNTVFTPPSGTIYFGGGTLIRGDDVPGPARRLIVFDANTDTVTFQDLQIDFNNFESNGSLFYFGAGAHEMILLERLGFIDSGSPVHLGGSNNDAAIHSVITETNDRLIIRFCTMEETTHQFFRGQNDAFSVMTRLQIVNNEITGGREAVISVTSLTAASDVNYATFDDVQISRNVLYNPWGTAILVGLPGTGTDRRWDGTNIVIANNFITLDARADSYSSSAAEGLIRLASGDEANSVCQAIIRANTVRTFDFRDDGIRYGIQLDNGTPAGPAPDVLIEDNLCNVIEFSGINRSSVRVQLNTAQLYPDIDRAAHALFYGDDLYYVDTQMDAPLDLIGALTITALVLLPDYPTPGQFFPIISKADGTNCPFALSINSDGQLVFFTENANNGLTLLSADAVPLHAWTHVAWTLSGLGQRGHFWFNGVEDSGDALQTAGSGQRAISTVNAFVGREGSNYANFALDDLRVYSTDEADMLEAIMRREPAGTPVLRYELNELAGTTVIEYSGGTNGLAVNVLPAHFWIGDGYRDYYWYDYTTTPEQVLTVPGRMVAVHVRGGTWDASFFTPEIQANAYVTCFKYSSFSHMHFDSVTGVVWDQGYTHCHFDNIVASSCDTIYDTRNTGLTTDRNDHNLFSNNHFFNGGSVIAFIEGPQIFQACHWTNIAAMAIEAFTCEPMLLILGGTITNCGDGAAVVSIDTGILRLEGVLCGEADAGVPTSYFKVGANGYVVLVDCEVVLQAGQALCSIPANVTQIRTTIIQL